MPNFSLKRFLLLVTFLFVLVNFCLFGGKIVFSCFGRCQDPKLTTKSLNDFDVEVKPRRESDTKPVFVFDFFVDVEVDVDTDTDSDISVADDNNKINDILISHNDNKMNVNSNNSNNEINKMNNNNINDNIKINDVIINKDNNNKLNHNMKNNDYKNNDCKNNDNNNNNATAAAASSRQNRTDQLPAKVKEVSRLDSFKEDKDVKSSNNLAADVPVSVRASVQILSSNISFEQSRVDEDRPSFQPWPNSSDSVVRGLRVNLLEL